MTTFTETDFKLLFEDIEQFDEWLETEFLEVRKDGPRPGIWVDVDGIGRMAQMTRSEKDTYLRQHPAHDLSAPVLPFPFAMADFVALTDSDCFKHSSARWPTDAAVEKARSVNPRTKSLMMQLQGQMLPAHQVAGGAPECEPTAEPVEPLPATAATALARLPAARLTWWDAAGPYVVARLKAERFGTAKELHRALERDAGAPESPFHHGTGDHRYCLVLRETGRPLTLKTMQNCWRELLEAADAK